jgi:hypothetical protein
MKRVTSTLAALAVATSAFGQAGPFTDRMIAAAKEYTFFGPQHNGPFTTLGYRDGDEAKCMTITGWMDGSAIVLRVDMSPTDTEQPPKLFIASPKFTFSADKINSQVKLTATFFDNNNRPVARGDFPNAIYDSKWSVITKPVNENFINRMLSSTKLVLSIENTPDIEVKLDFSRTAIQSLLRCIDDYDTLHKSK